MELEQIIGGTLVAAVGFIPGSIYDNFVFPWLERKEHELDIEGEDSTPVSFINTSLRYLAPVILSTYAASKAYEATHSISTALVTGIGLGAGLLLGEYVNKTKRDNVELTDGEIAILDVNLKDLRHAAVYESIGDYQRVERELLKHARDLSKRKKSLTPYSIIGQQIESIQLETDKPRVLNSFLERRGVDYASVLYEDSNGRINILSQENEPPKYFDSVAIVFDGNEAHLYTFDYTEDPRFGLTVSLDPDAYEFEQRASLSSEYAQDVAIAIDAHGKDRNIVLVNCSISRLSDKVDSAENICRQLAERKLRAPVIN